MPQKKMNDVVFEDCRIIFRNFSGVEGRFNAAGDRNFNLLLDEATAQAMLADGWNVKWLKPREEGDDPQPRIEVSVSYKGRPPRVVLITSRGRTNLPEDMIQVLDFAEFENVDLILHPYFWEVNGKSGIKAYLASIYVTIHEDELERKYADVPDSAQSAMIVDAEIVDEEIEAPRNMRAITSGQTPF